MLENIVNLKELEQNMVQIAEKPQPNKFIPKLKYIKFVDSEKNTKTSKSKKKRGKNLFSDLLLQSSQQNEVSSSQKINMKQQQEAQLQQQKDQQLSGIEQRCQTYSYANTLRHFNDLQNSSLSSKIDKRALRIINNCKTRLNTTTEGRRQHQENNFQDMRLTNTQTSFGMLNKNANQVDKNLPTDTGDAIYQLNNINNNNNNNSNFINSNAGDQLLISSFLEFNKGMQEKQTDQSANTYTNMNNNDYRRQNQLIDSEQIPISEMKEQFQRYDVIVQDSPSFINQEKMYNSLQQQQQQQRLLRSQPLRQHSPPEFQHSGISSQQQQFRPKEKVNIVKLVKSKLFVNDGLDFVNNTSNYYIGNNPSFYSTNYKANNSFYKINKSFSSQQSSQGVNQYNINRNQGFRTPSCDINIKRLVAVHQQMIRHKKMKSELIKSIQNQIIIERENNVQTDQESLNQDIALQPTCNSVNGVIPQSNNNNYKNEQLGGPPTYQIYTPLKISNNFINKFKCKQNTEQKKRCNNYNNQYLSNFQNEIKCYQSNQNGTPTKINQINSQMISQQNYIQFEMQLQQPAETNNPQNKQFIFTKSFYKKQNKKQKHLIDQDTSSNNQIKSNQYKIIKI